jgi:hypothetical protein
VTSLNKSRLLVVLHSQFVWSVCIRDARLALSTSQSYRKDRVPRNGFIVDSGRRVRYFSEQEPRFISGEYSLFESVLVCVPTRFVMVCVKTSSKLVDFCKDYYGQLHIVVRFVYKPCYLSEQDISPNSYVSVVK